MKACVYMQGKRIKMFGIKARFGLLGREARREAENIPTKNVCEAKEEPKKRRRMDRKRVVFHFRGRKKNFRVFIRRVSPDGTSQPLCKVQ